MKQIRKVILVLLSILPIKAISFAAEYGESVEFPSVDLKKMEEEFFNKLDNKLLPPKYYVFLEKHEIYTSTELKEERNAGTLYKVLFRYSVERIDSKILASTASSILPD